MAPVREVGATVKARHARRIRAGIMAGRAGDIDAGMRLHGLAWRAFYRTRTSQRESFWVSLFPSKEDRDGFRCKEP